MAQLPRKPVIGITMGDPAGIGAEVIVKALADPALRGQARFVVYGMNELLAYAADLAEIDPYWHRLQHDAERAEHALVHEVVCLDYDEYSMLGSSVHKPTKQGGQASRRFIDDALLAAQRPIDQAGVDALVTAPISKTSWALAGFDRWPGHTEYLQSRTKSKRVAMMFHAEQINTVLATIHIPLMDIRNQLTIGRVFDAIDLGHDAMRQLGVAKPKIAVCGLNPHAGEDGLFGDEEIRLIRPAIEVANKAGIDARGPFPADTLFTPAHLNKYDLFVAMYHDQGLIPVKMLAFDSAVNTTLGLPIIRTSPDHGTAFDLVGKNKADAGSMRCAIQLAIRQAKHQAAADEKRKAV
ncbi:MAG: 4-hydroxythreonine-4-phosphate dehydrogenase PdxA [Phycisphaeraceae bacterium]|nr:4-hydroxythreonine-4-phosphate dehydrogenase PdxA [Phycisphaeraceae bacterium]